MAPAGSVGLFKATLKFLKKPVERARAKPLGVAARPRFTSAELPKDVSKVRLKHLGGGTHLGTFLAEYEGKTLGVYKSRLSNSKLVRERAAWVADDHLGLGLVPHTRIWHGPHGIGSIQDFVQNEGPVFAQKGGEHERMAALDYIIGSGDRHPANALRREDGGIAAVDNEHAFPKTTPGMIRSDFVVRHLNEPLSPDLVSHLRSVDPVGYAQALRETGLSDAAVKGSTSRLIEIQTHGKIMGESWKGAIADSGFNVYHPPGVKNMGDYMTKYMIPRGSH
jgi:hypothetical protein